MQPLKINGYRIVECHEIRHGSNGIYNSFDVLAIGERYHYEGLEGAVEAAQQWPQTPEKLPDPITPALADELHSAISEARRGHGEQGGTDYTLRGLVDLVRTAIEADREARS